MAARWHVAHIPVPDSLAAKRQWVERWMGWLGPECGPIPPAFLNFSLPYSEHARQADVTAAEQLLLSRLGTLTGQPLQWQAWQPSSTFSTLLGSSTAHADPNARGALMACPCAQNPEVKARHQADGAVWIPVVREMGIPLPDPIRWAPAIVLEGSGLVIPTFWHQLEG